MKCQIPTVKYVQVNQIRKRSKMVTVVKFLYFYSGRVVCFLQWGQIDPMVLLT